MYGRIKLWAVVGDTIELGMSSAATIGQSSKSSVTRILNKLVKLSFVGCIKKSQVGSAHRQSIFVQKGGVDAGYAQQRQPKTTLMILGTFTLRLGTPPDMGTKCTTGHYSESTTLFCVHFGKDSFTFFDCLFQCVKRPLL